MEIFSKQESVISHYKEGELVAITHTNGVTKLLKVTPMMQKDFQDFYQTNEVKE